jgi:hypothetical protein
MAAILAGLAAATQLTSLHLGSLFAARSFSQHMGLQHDVMPQTLCDCLAGLTGLKSLGVQQVCHMLAPGDALALTALTDLIRLHLSDLCDGVGEVEAIAKGVDTSPQLHDSPRGGRIPVCS